MIRVLIENNSRRNADVTSSVQDLQWTCSDPGGCETASFTLADSIEQPAAGSIVRITDGLTPLWVGYVDEPGDGFKGDTAGAQVNCVGAGALLKDSLMSMIFIDRDLSRWGPQTARRLINLKTAGWVGVQDFEVTPDPLNGAPAIITKLTGPWTTRAICEAWYDAGFGNEIGYITVTWARGDTTQVNFADVNWTWLVVTAVDDDHATNLNTGNLRAAGPSTLTQVGSTNFRYATLQQTYTGTAGGNGIDYPLVWSKVFVVGDHGLTQHGSSGGEGFYASDIAKYVAGQVGAALDDGQIESSSSFIVQQSVYYTPVTYEQIIDDMAKLMGWHWGVWPGRGFSNTPVFDFRAPPTSATATVDRKDCQLTLTSRLSDMYNQAVVTYTDVSGSPASVTITSPDPRLSSAGRTRTLLVDAGTTDLANATIYGTQLLALQQSDTRSSGSGTLPATVITSRGTATKPSHFLRPGIDKLKVVGTPEVGISVGTRNTSWDVYRIARTTCTMQAGGVVTSVELDRGATLLDTLNARLAIATQLGGF